MNELKIESIVVVLVEIFLNVQSNFTRKNQKDLFAFSQEWKRVFFI